MPEASVKASSQHSGFMQSTLPCTCHCVLVNCQSALAGVSHLPADSVLSYTSAYLQVSTGGVRVRWSRAHGDARITCMAFDANYRRLFTGCETGGVKVNPPFFARRLNTFWQPDTSQCRLCSMRTSVTSTCGSMCIGSDTRSESLPSICIKT